ncbi:MULTISPECIES: HNH endonuclease [Pseudomonas]|uniref:HNH endonuclease n=1 Tax=Pseudomonas helleri TaxID=1608996 RepID=A0A7X1WBW8_9PSED|nr:MULTISPECIES: HNH endonuclease [Pseudomonas]MQT49013.1 HNH endonuclease [Pseudomonas helleri]
MELVVNEEQVAENLAELDRARALADADGKIYRDLIKRGTCYLPYLTDAGIAFAPSRFIGYVGNKVHSHSSNREKHGSDTNIALNKIYGSYPALNESLQLAFESFCVSIGVAPSRKGSFGVTRKYWVTDDVSEVIAKGQEQQILSDAMLTETEKSQLILARVGQGAFRKKLVKHWGKCSATGCSQIDILKASHIKPWRESSNTERLDLYNGLLLNPSLDALFDKGYVSFDDKGAILISPYLSESDRKILNCSEDLRVELAPAHLKYLAWHREHLYWAEIEV